MTLPALYCAFAYLATAATLASKGFVLAACAYLACAVASSVLAYVSR